MQNGQGTGMDFEKRLAELEGEKERCVAAIKGLEAEANKLIASMNEQGQHLTRNLQRLEGAIAFIRAEVLRQPVGEPAPEPEKPLIEVAQS